MPWGQPKLSSTPSAPVSSTWPRIASQFFSSHGTISETTRARSGHLRLTSLISLQIHAERPIGDELDVVEPDDLAVRGMDGAIARAVDVDDRRVFAQGFPYHAAPARPEGALDVVLLVGRGRRGEPERVGRPDTAEHGCEIGHDAFSLARRRGISGAEITMDRQGGLLSRFHRRHREVLAAGHAIAAGPHALNRGASLIVGADAAVVERQSLVRG